MIMKNNNKSHHKELPIGNHYASLLQTTDYFSLFIIIVLNITLFSRENCIIIGFIFLNKKQRVCF